MTKSSVTCFVRARPTGLQHQLGGLDVALANLTRARLTPLLLFGIGTVHDLTRSYDLGGRSVRVATHCTEAEIPTQHIATARECGMDVAGFLMMSHMTDPETLPPSSRVHAHANLPWPAARGRRGRGWTDWSRWTATRSPWATRGVYSSSPL
jgi:isopropylmalate/homocitrate/citramalate synthase